MSRAPLQRLQRVALTCSGILALGLASCSKSGTSDVKNNPDEGDVGTTANRTDDLPATVTFNAHIRPIFSDTCFSCHGFDAKTREADLRLDTPEGAYAALADDPDLKGIVPGDPAKSAAWQRIISDDEDELMPPPKFHKPLSDYQKRLIGRWIEQGAQYEEHWAYMPIEKPEAPALEKHADKVANPIDAFVLKRLEEQGIEPTPLADPATLLRRLSLDLIGLPPTPDELEAFLKDDSPDAYEKQVDRLLASPHFGERMAVQWLDVARYADTVGLHGDQNQHIFPYRDYVIKAFNDNMPFDRFTIEQLAGDLLENPTDEQLIATGFIRLAQMTREGGAQPKEYLAKYASDRVRAVGAAWLGQTTGCAECHDHKFDPISTKDFYSLSAFFRDFKQWGVYSPYDSSPNPELKGFNNESPFPPEVVIVSETQLARTRHHQDQAALQQAANGRLDEEWISGMKSYLETNPNGWAAAKPAEAISTKSTPATILEDGSVLFEGKPRKDDVITLRLDPTEGRVHTIQVEVLPHEKLGGNHGRAENGTFNLKWPEFRTVGKNGSKQLKVEWAQADHAKIQNHLYRNGYQPLKLPEVWMSATFPLIKPEDFQRRPHHAIFILQSPVDFADGEYLEVSLKSADVGRVRISTTPFVEAIAGQPAPTPAFVEALKAADSQRSEAQKDLLAGNWALMHLAPSELSSNLPSMRQTIREGRSGIARSLIAWPIEEKDIPVVRILPRGDWQNETGEIVEPAVLHFLPQPEAAGKRRLNRLDLAKWIVSNDNPLTARHIMNRIWKQFYGTGISNILDDLGSQGEWPSHPKLLDWLASEFRDSGWDTKHMVKLMVMSRTYRQQSAVREDLRDIDPYNRLLASQSARRLDAEFIRDNALAAAGLLEAGVIGGPSVRPYQPPGYYAALQFPDREYETQTTGDQYRRSVYMHWQRTFLHPMLANFDAPSREECAADRLQANSPLQALTLLNDPAAVEMARHFALQLLSKEGSTQERLREAWQRTLVRTPSHSEIESMERFIGEQVEHYTAKADDAKALIGASTLPGNTTVIEAAAWTQACRVLLNLHETITRY